MNTEPIEDQLNREHLEIFASENTAEPSLEVALEVVKREMIATREKMIEKGHTDWQSVYISLNYASDTLGFTLYGSKNTSGTGDTLEKALADLESIEDAKAKRIAELRAELAKLEAKGE